MKKNTPQFNSLLEQYYSQQHPGKRVCAETGDEFEISQKEFESYKKLNVPLPTVAPHIRFRRQRAHIGGIELFMRKTINDKPIVSMYDPDSPALLITNEEWHADSFDAMKYASDINPDEPFFEQWYNFSKKIPTAATDSDPKSQNCSWSLYALRFKDAYATYGGVECEDIMYADMCLWSSHAADVTNIVRSEWMYDSTNTAECSNTFFSENCDSCLDSYFCFGCVKCSNCFGCVNQQNKQYCFFNTQLTEEEYKKRMSEIDLTDARIVNQLKEKISLFWQKGYHITEQNFKSENVIGDIVMSSNDTTGISVAECERSRNIFDASGIKDSNDICTCSYLEKSYNITCCTDGFENKMSLNCDKSIDIEYCKFCSSCEHCFGCIGLDRKKFCIFNKQYTEEEYWGKLDNIKSNMFKRGEYGQFFPYHTSLIAYNVSHADVFFPLSKDQVEKLSARWFNFQKADTSQALPIDQMPNKLENTSDDVLTKQFICPESGRPFRIVQPELEFHKTVNLALPRVHPSIRRKHRYKRMLGLHLFKDTCEHCKKDIWTRQKSSSTTHLLCSTCYHKMLLNNADQR